MSEDLVGQILGALVNRDGNNNGLGGGDGALWLIIILVLFGGWGNRGYGNQGGGYGAGNVGGNELYPWLSQSEQISNGFAAAATQLCNCCSDMQMALANGFAGVEANANARQIANMQQGFGMQTAMMQGFNAAQAQTSQFAYDTGLAMANQTATILAEHCADRSALSDGVRDIIASQVAGTQRILDQMCQDKIDAKNEEIANLRQQVNMMNLAASQNAQTAKLLADNFAQTNALEQYLAPVPRPAYIVQNPNCCQQGFGCGCGCGVAA